MEQRKVLSNGLIAIADPLERRYACLYVGINVGSKNESREKKGGAHLLEHMMFRSNEFRTADQIAEDSEFHGMQSNAHTSQTTTTIEITFPPEHLALAVELAYQAVTSRSLKQGEFETERNGPVTDELVMGERNPTIRFYRNVLFPALFRGTPFEDPIIGTFESVRSLTLDDVLRLKEAFYVPNNTVIAVSGAVQPTQVFDEVEKTFGTLQPKDTHQPSFTWEFKPGVTYVEFDDLKDKAKPEQDQALVFIAHPVHGLDHPDAASLELLANMIGNGFTSHMFRELRRKRGIGYAPSAAHLSIAGNAVMYMGIPGIHPTQLETAVDIMDGIVADVKTATPESRFLAGKKTQLITSAYIHLDEPSWRAQWWIKQELEQHYYDFRQVCPVIAALTTEHIQDVAQRNLRERQIIIASAPEYSNKFQNP